MTTKIPAQEKPSGKTARKNVNIEKNARRLELIQKRLDAGLLSERFPQIASMAIHIVQFYGVTGQVFVERTIHMVPGNNLYLLHMTCMEGNCHNGGFDLTSKVEELVRNNRKAGKGKMLCGKADASGISHASISYDISIKYS
ncbi:MAG: hypothetical protein M0Z75_17945 [Nitrospiraceae bacterium]|nr:hypothetical protein [Nitrospiraceae bacterium]